jgi:uroporphyrinogen decarboxylase
MIPRDRVIATLNHQEPDRVPIDLGSTVVTSIGRDAYEHLRAELGLPPHPLEIVDVVQQLPRIQEDLLVALGVELRAVGPNGPSTWKLDIKDEGDSWSYLDEWGSKLEMPKRDGHYFDWVEFPIKESTLDALAAFTWPNPDDPARYAGVRARAQRAYDAGYALVGTPPLGSDLMAMPQRTRGYAESMLDLAADEAFVEAFLDRLLDMALRAWGHFLDEVGDLVQVAVTFEDLGTQIGPLISPAQYRRILKPRQRKLVDLIKSRSKAKVFLHSCGAVAEFIPDFVDIGIDILNPVQVTAVGLEDTAKLKRDWGKHLTFWGGACATTTLAFGSVEDVRAEAAQRARDLMPGGGFVFAAVHNIQSEVPAEKVRALFETARDVGRYAGIHRR